MSILNKDILFLIFEELQNDSKSLFLCLMVNRLWCETAVPVLWRNPWSYHYTNYKRNKYLFIIIAHYLFDNIKEYITEQRIQLPSLLDKSLLFDYLSFCKSINVKIINSIISIGSSLAYNQFLMQQEFYYYFFIKKSSELKYLDMRSIKHQIFYFPESKVHLESICELRCDTSIDSSYFYGLSQICQYIQRFIIYNTKPQPNNGIAKLIEVQKNLKHFEWINEFHDDYLKDPYVEIFLALEKKANSLNYLRVFIDYVNNIAHTLFQEILPKFYKLKILKIDAYPFFTEEQLKKLKMQVYYDLEILNIEYNELNVISSVIENSGGHLKKILFSPYKTYDYGYPPNLKENSLNFIRKVYEYCPSIEYLSILFSPSEEHFTELEKLLKICQNIKSLLIVMKRIVGDKEYGKKLLEILIRSAPMNLKEIRIGKEFKFSLENLKKFLDRWRSRPALSLFILTSDPIYIGEDFTRLIDKYKSDGVIKDFKYGSHTNDIDYVFNI